MRRNARAARARISLRAFDVAESVRILSHLDVCGWAGLPEGHSVILDT